MNMPSTMSRAPPHARAMKPTKHTKMTSGEGSTAPMASPSRNWSLVIHAPDTTASDWHGGDGVSRCPPPHREARTHTNVCPHLNEGYGGVGAAEGEQPAQQAEHEEPAE
jgi:hypothetical protein